MNKHRLTVLADWLERGAPHAHIRFDMRTYIAKFDKNGRVLPDCDVNVKPEDVCSTACCMAGVLTQTYAPHTLVRNGRVILGVPIWRIAAQVAGLTRTQAYLLFVPPTIPLNRITAKEAAKVVRHLVATGVVDWRVAGYGHQF